MNKIIEIKNISFKYDKDYILEQINFDIYKGDFIGIIGANGTGKSTLVKLILGQLKPTEGSVKLFDTDVANFRNFSIIGYVPQVGVSNGLDFPATVEEIVMMNLYKEIGLFKFPNKEHKNKVREALEKVNMVDFRKRKFSDLSGGQQQRIIIAKALVNNPEILILDEPTTGIDHKSEELLYGILERLNKESGITILMISHNINKIKKYSSRLIELKNNYEVGDGE